MLSPELMRYIIDPDRECETQGETRKIVMEKHISKFSITDFIKLKIFFKEHLASFGVHRVHSK